MKNRKTPGSTRLDTAKTVLATLTLLAATPARGLVALPAGTPATHLEGVTPQAAAGALMGEGNLSAAQLDAPDHLGNRNGSYDLGDLLSWFDLCPRGELDCGSTPAPPPAPLFGMGALLSGRAFARRRVREIHAMSGSTRSRPRCDPDAFGRPLALPASWRGMALWYGVVVLLGAALLWGCTDGDDLVRPVSLEPNPGYLTEYRAVIMR
ncbi:MAG: hypothetical protein OXI76_06065 [Gemmatimonadota bacterium]|nr:hypothetical protein [Gemmatimonadota bacterium]